MTRSTSTVVLLPALVLTASLAAQAQHTEWATQADATLSAFRGPSADASTILIADESSGRGRSNNSYSKKVGLGYALAVQGQRIGRGGGLLGLQAGYERLNSAIDIYKSDNISDQRGRASLTNQFVKAHPFFGRRFSLGSTDVDVTAGPELALLLSSREHGKADEMTNAGTTTYRINLDRTQPALDARARISLTAYRKHLGISASYAHGFSNYRRNWDGGTNEVYSQTWRLGLVYRLGS